MDHIKKALDEAKKNKAEAEGSKDYNWTGSKPADQNSELKALDIKYDTTKVVGPSSDHAERNRILSDETSSLEVVQAYKLLRTQILQKLSLNNWNSFAVVSPTSGNGKTLTAINLAISLAKEVKKSVLLVDFDFRDPNVAECLGVDLQHDIGDFLFNEEPLSSAMFNPGVERLVVLGNKTAITDSSELLSSPKLITLVEELKQRYDNRIVIVDLPPMLTYDDSIAFMPYVDALLMVVEEGRTTKEELEQCAERIGDKPLLGTVLNKGMST